MRNLLLIGVVFVVLGVYFYMENQARSSSYTTPEEAVFNTSDPSLEVQQLIETKTYDQTAYVFFYTQVGEEEGNYLAVAKVNKNEDGWRLEEAVGLGDMNQRQEGSATGTDHFIAAYASPKTARVTYGPYEAEEIDLDHNLIRLFFLHGLEEGLESDDQFSYFDESGNELPQQ
ncbi:hypothetical protein [Jeotgalibacillus sp. JSM ZJ347]|uniref:hypothetical protein n=1 Tax=Jeotgalibacillus sp. JSM ZJ347 TaxID=3342117 RepID=UPI0035A896F0